MKKTKSEFINVHAEYKRSLCWKSVPFETLASVGAILLSKFLNNIFCMVYSIVENEYIFLLLSIQKVRSVDCVSQFISITSEMQMNIYRFPKHLFSSNEVSDLINISDNMEDVVSTTNHSSCFMHTTTHRTPNMSR